MKIRKASTRDFVKIAKIMLEEFGKPPFKDKAPLRSVLKTLKFYNKMGVILVLELERKIIGAAVFKVEQYWKGRVIIIEDLVIDSKFKKDDLGSFILKNIEKYAKKKKIKSIYFNTHKKSPSLNKYKKIGYKEDKNIIFMHKNLKWQT